jgi:hypothetical protein
MPRLKPTDAGREGLKAGTAPKTADGLLTLGAVAEAIRRIYAISEAANSTSLTPAGTVAQVGGKRSAAAGPRFIRLEGAFARCRPRRFLLAHFSPRQAP